MPGKRTLRELLELYRSDPGQLTPAELRDVRRELARRDKKQPADEPAPPPQKPKKPPKIWRPAFLAALANLGNVTAAAKAVPIDRGSVYRAREKDATFAAAMADAIDASSDLMEIEARRRAVDGWEEPVYGSGGDGIGTVQVGTIRKYSDTLLIFLLKGAKPDKYRERHQVTHAVSDGQICFFLPENGRDQAAARAADPVPGKRR